MLKHAVTLSLLVICALSRPVHAGPIVLKVATLAPEDSSWMNLLKEWRRAVEGRAGKDVIAIRLFPNGQMGDEQEMIPKMRAGQLQAGALTSVGLALIDGDVRALELPMLIRSYAEMDCVRDGLDADLHEKLAGKGFVLLGWGDVGPIHFFSRMPLRSVSDLRKTRPWAWGEDLLTLAMYQQLHVNPVKLGVPEVQSYLQNGTINAFYGSPLSTLALQWHTRVKYITSATLTIAIGATLMTRKAFDALPAPVQAVLREESKHLEERLRKQVRDDNDKALSELKKAGLKMDDTPAAMQLELADAAMAARASLEPKVYGTEFRLKVEKQLATCRAGRK